MLLYLVTVTGSGGDLLPLIFVTIYLTYKFVYSISFWDVNESSINKGLLASKLADF